VTKLTRPLPLLAALLCSFALSARAQAPAPPESERIELTCADGVKLYAFWYAQGKSAQSPVALLLHDPGATHAHWRPLLEPLRTAGFRILAPDLRGHGDSKDPNPEVYASMVRRESQPYLDMSHDVEAALQWLTGVQGVAPERIALVGGEYSADLALQAMARRRTLGAVVAMSPSERYFGFPLLETTKKIGNKPLFVLVPKQILGDGAAKMQELNKNNPSFKLEIYPVYEHHGVHMLGLSWRVEDTIVRWLQQVFALEP